VPCAGDWYSWTWDKYAFVQWKQDAPFWHPRLKARMELVLACDYYSVLDVLMLDNYKNCKSYYFVKVRGFTVQREEAGRIVTDISFEVPPVCFYLGSYPIYWSEQLMGVLYAHSRRTRDTYAFGPEPWVSFVDMPLFQYIPRDRWDLYMKKIKIDSYLAQEKILQGRKIWQTMCLMKNYPPEVKPGAPTQKKVYLPEGTFDWPGIPTTEIPLPLAEQPASLVPGIPRLYIIYWIEGDVMKLELYYDWGPPPPTPVLPT